MKKPKQGKSLRAVLEDAKPDFLVRYAEPDIQEWVKKANNEMWNWEQCANHASLAGLTSEQF